MRILSVHKSLHAAYEGQILRDASRRISTKTSLKRQRNHRRSEQQFWTSIIESNRFTIQQECIRHTTENKDLERDEIRISLSVRTCCCWESLWDLARLSFFALSKIRQHNLLVAKGKSYTLISTYIVNWRTVTPVIRLGILLH